MKVAERELGEKNAYKGHLSFVETFTKRELLLLKIKLDSISENDYVIELYEYDRLLRPAMRFKYKGKWKKNYTVAFDPMKDYHVKDGMKYLLRFVFYIQNNIEVYYHGFINIK